MKLKASSRVVLKKTPIMIRLCSHLFICSFRFGICCHRVSSEWQCVKNILGDGPNQSRQSLLLILPIQVDVRADTTLQQMNITVQYYNSLRTTLLELLCKKMGHFRAKFHEPYNSWGADKLRHQHVHFG